MLRRLLVAFWLTICAGVWRWLGVRPAGRVLVRHLGAVHEDTRAVAGMLLAKAGRKALTLLAEAADRREHLECVLPMLADLGETHYEPLMRDMASQSEPLMAKTGRDSLALLERHRRQATVAP
jgi:hypothetical protein